VNAETDKYWMRVALQHAEQAGQKGEVPVGAVLVRDGKLLAAAGNEPIALSDPCAHAEIRVLREAARLENNYRLPGSTLYVTLEPCTMCVGAIVHARVSHLVFAAFEPKAGAVVSQNNLLDQPYMNSHVAYESGVMADAASQLLTQFFEARRAQKKLEKASQQIKEQQQASQQ
jgi:tRNA(adenine34) deaminase